ncbi:SCO family protein [Erythrobacter dokdonensis]|uniref:Electron transport protein n=1 Tax=Erythrobacter dokdonensis DSW-74 TaxID=1300349 RepID=A0A1A7BG56_9SPHN|nr:SCO family protein [Erythrobacter dokdonensis]OBV10200.1 Electron transport protein [Erythrobacter dokdonensis DSW-74]
MNRLNNPSPSLTALFAAVTLALAGCNAGAPAAEPPLAGADIGGDFALTSSTGETVRWSDFAGKYRVVYFGYAFCPDICPTDMQRVAQGLKVLKADDPDKAAKTQPIFITIDPERDTPEVVGEFAAAFSPDIIGLTGTPEQIAAAAKAFRVFYAKGEPVEGGGYLVDHSNIVYLFGPEGEPLATLPVDEGADAVAAELDKWVS